MSRWITFLLLHVCSWVVVVESFCSPLPLLGKGAQQRARKSAKFASNSPQWSLSQEAKRQNNNNDDGDVGEKSTSKGAETILSRRWFVRGGVLMAASSSSLILGKKSPAQAIDNNDEEDAFAALGRALKSKDEGVLNDAKLAPSFRSGYPFSPSPLPTATSTAAELTAIGGSPPPPPPPPPKEDGNVNSSSNDLEAALKDAAKQRRIAPLTHG